MKLVAISVKLQRWTRPSKDYNINKGKNNMNTKYYNVSSVRLMRFLYALGFNKESYITQNGKENWRFEKSEDLQEALDFFYYMRNKNR